jgi:hypothetical protein
VRTVIYSSLILSYSHRAHDTDLQNGSIQFGRTAGNDDETRSDGDEVNMFGNESTPGDSGDDGRRDDDDLDSPGSDGHVLNPADDHKRYHGYKGAQGDGGGGAGDGGGGPTSMDGKWESPLHRTRVKLRLKPNTADTYSVAIGYTFKV